MDHLSDSTHRGQSGTADHWPDWTDDVRWGIGADPDDESWWASQNAESDDDSPDPDDPIWDDWAGESDAMDRLERGIVGI